MNPFTLATVRESSNAEMKALEEVCIRLSGFNPDLNVEWVDGFLTSLATGPVMPDVAQWLPALCGDSFERSFADPADHAQALRCLTTRLKVLAAQLDPGALLDDPSAMRLAPVMMEWDDAARQMQIDKGVLAAKDSASLVTGNQWVSGFFAAQAAFGDHWPLPNDAPSIELFNALIAQITALLFRARSKEMKKHVAKFYPNSEPTQDDLVVEACFAVQDLRLFWLDHTPKPAQRVVAATPGRNEPCHCGSGKKFKKCHGA